MHFNVSSSIFDFLVPNPEMGFGAAAVIKIWKFGYSRENYCIAKERYNQNIYLGSQRPQTNK